MSCACLLSLRGRLRLLGFGCLRACIWFGRGISRGRFSRICFSDLRLVARVDAERGERGLGGNERHAAVLFIVTPDGVIALGASLFD